MFRRKLDGYGVQGCECVTILSLRSTPKKILTSVVIVLGGVAIFGALLALDPRKKNTRQSKTEESLEPLPLKV
jgi:hypothetical protein